MYKQISNVFRWPEKCLYFVLKSSQAVDFVLSAVFIVSCSMTPMCCAVTLE